MYGAEYHPKFGLAMSRLSQGNLKKELIKQIRTAEFIMFTETTCEDSEKAKKFVRREVNWSPLYRCRPHENA
jgi:hypothetical protein